MPVIKKLTGTQFDIYIIRPHTQLSKCTETHAHIHWRSKSLPSTDFPNNSKHLGIKSCSVRQESNKSDPHLLYHCSVFLVLSLQLNTGNQLVHSAQQMSDGGRSRPQGQRTRKRETARKQAVKDLWGVKRKKKLGQRDWWKDDIIRDVVKSKHRLP